MTTGIHHDIIQTVRDCIGVQYHADCTIYASKYEICRHRFGTQSGTPVAPGPSPLWYPIWHPCGTRSVTRVAPVSHLQLWVPNLVPNLVPFKGATWAPYFLGAKWRLMGCRFLDKGLAP